VPRFQAPGPGSWSLDTAHFPRPVTRFVSELFAAPAKRGFRAATARYGLLLDHIEWAFVQRWAYLCPHPVAALDEQRAWDEVAPLLRERLAASEQVFAQRRWRADVREWDERTKPRLPRGHAEQQAVDPGALDDGALVFR